MSLKNFSGVLNATQVQELYRIAKSNNFAIPGVNVTQSSNVNACMEVAKKINAPVMIQLSYGGAQFWAGKSLDNSHHQASVLGAVSAAKHIHLMAQEYGVKVLIHTDHAAKKLLPWIDGLLEYSKAHKAQYGRALFSSHMIDLSSESLDENLQLSSQYLKKMDALDIALEMELGVTGGEEDGVNNMDVDQSKLYTQEKEVYDAYQCLKNISKKFTIAAAFGNVHGVYQSGSVKLSPKILRDSQAFIIEKCNLKESKPVSFVFHGGSGSSSAEIKEAISYGVVKMNIDTDLQWAYWKGVYQYYQSNASRLHQQIGNLESPTAPNKKYYDPRVWIRAAEQCFAQRLIQSYEELNALDVNKLL